MELPRFNDFQEVYDFFSKKFTAYSGVYSAIIDLITDEMHKLYGTESPQLAMYFFIEFWNRFVDNGIPEDLSTKEHLARDVLLVKLMNDLKKEVAYDP